MARPKPYVSRPVRQPAPSAPENLHSSFLSLPTELRLQILGYLLPDVDLIRPRCASGSHLRPSTAGKYEYVDEFDEFGEAYYIPTRTDGESSHPSIMRVNRQVYKYCQEIVYQNRHIEVAIRRQIEVFGHSFDPVSDPDWALKFKEATKNTSGVTIAVSLSGTRREEISKKFQLSALAYVLSGNASLRVLNVNIWFRQFDKNNTPLSPNEGDALWLIEGLGTIRNIPEVEIVNKSHDVGSYSDAFLGKIQSLSQQMRSNLPIRESDRPMLGFYPLYMKYLLQIVQRSRLGPELTNALTVFQKLEEGAIAACFSKKAELLRGLLRDAGKMSPTASERVETEKEERDCLNALESFLRNENNDVPSRREANFGADT
ncbi:hypothetical protein BLS_001114 [Venturia inaequalis]|uniref:F-box domain-containing protein n=1 Tax=Venturia inaequalis TaxID=5025 RepID=A0A8H3YLE9_VENIN|nr:hypothetical protein BLS_001114 [Venturia inaequalis]KAE9966913.1 hypothetical protein EG327_011684 [Venturia inaequalis]KAE9980774.1 hypothetical protein EG328_012022 [Venturia inaequalis]RDI77013.1 hypothetical protein Vi05172_g12998 [Venturia inaequalis]